MKKANPNNSLLRTVSQVKSIWNKERPSTQSFWQTQFEEQSLLDRLGLLFCFGPFYFYIFDFTDLKFKKFSDSTFNITDLQPNLCTLEGFLSIMHHKDIDHFQTCERVVGNFLFGRINSKDILNYKVSYFFRLRKPNGKYHIFHHQAVAISLDKYYRIKNVIGIHTDVNHLFKSRPNQLSFTHLQGGNSYLRVNPYNPHFDDGRLALPLISVRERQVLELFAQGFNDKEVGEELYISPHTVRKHRDNIRSKLNAKNTTHAVTLALQQELI